MRKGRNAVIAALALGGLVLAANPAQAQQKWTIEGRGGVGIPVGDLADLVDAGPSFGVGISYQLHPRIDLLLSGGAEILSGVDADAAGPEAPDINLYHYNLGAVFHVLEPGMSRWSVDVNAGAGATTFDSDSFTTTAGTDDFSETYFTANGGLRIGYDVTPRVNVFVGGQVYLIFADEDDTAQLAALRTDVDAFDTVASIPVEAGVAIRF
ncbi:MAG: outer membrane beta-barrel protein [Gemmatimonadota bacterium]|nr:outer membrane beta-barrel protein [Gemmatimonadota bacterium]